MVKWASVETITITLLTYEVYQESRQTGATQPMFVSSRHQSLKLVKCFEWENIWKRVNLENYRISHRIGVNIYEVC